MDVVTKSIFTFKPKRAPYADGRRHHQTVSDRWSLLCDAAMNAVSLELHVDEGVQVGQGLGEGGGRRGQGWMLCLWS